MFCIYTSIATISIGKDVVYEISKNKIQISKFKFNFMEKNSLDTLYIKIFPFSSTVK